MLNCTEVSTTDNPAFCFGVRYPWLGVASGALCLFAHSKPPRQCQHLVAMEFPCHMIYSSELPVPDSLQSRWHSSILHTASWILINTKSRGLDWVRWHICCWCFWNEDMSLKYLYCVSFLLNKLGNVRIGKTTGAFVLLFWLGFSFLNIPQKNT
jgi:hypothetical protein